MKPTLAIVGLGYWGKKLLDRFLSLDCKVKWLCDPVMDPNYGKAAGILYTASSLDEALDQDAENIDAVVIAAPAGQHYRLARRALSLGKHVLCEKPLCTDLGDAHMLIESVVPGQVLMTGHTYLFHPQVQAIKEHLGTVGEITVASSRRLGPGTERPDCSVIFDLGAHDVSIFNYLFDAVPNHVQALGCREECALIMDYGKFPVQTYLSWRNPTKVRLLEVRGTVSSLSMQEGAGIPAPDPEPLTSMAQHFLDCITRGRPCISGPAFTGRVMEVLCAAERSLALGGERVKLWA